MRRLAIGMVGLLSAAGFSFGAGAARAATTQSSLTAGVGTVNYSIYGDHYGNEAEGPFVVTGAFVLGGQPYVGTLTVAFSGFYSVYSSPPPSPTVTLTGTGANAPAGTCVDVDFTKMPTELPLYPSGYGIGPFNPTLAGLGWVAPDNRVLSCQVSYNGVDFAMVLRIAAASVLPVTAGYGSFAGVVAASTVPPIDGF